MNNDELEISINNFEKDVDKLNGEEVLKVYMKYIFFNIIYKVIMMENMYLVIEVIRGWEDGKDLGILFFYDYFYFFYRCFYG